MSEHSFSTTRRAALAVIGAGLIAPSLVTPAVAADADAAAAVAKAVEALRAAMVAGDEKVMKALVHDRLSYSHSDAHQETKALFIKNLAGPNAPGKFNFIKLSDQTIDVVGDVAVVRHVFDAENPLPDGKVAPAHIKVLQIWKKTGGKWQLLARASTKL
jgi:ketosteroid isomerase-like protein